MNTNRLDYTCSMGEISIDDVCDIESKDSFFKELLDCGIANKECGIDSSLKILIYNSENRKYDKCLRNIGFKKVASYKGNNTDYKGKPKTINTFILVITQKFTNEIKRYIKSKEKEEDNYVSYPQFVEF